MAEITTEVTLKGSATAFGEGNKIVSYRWEQTSGNTSPKIENPNSATTRVTGYNTPGTYLYKLTATDANGETGAAETKVTVLAANIAPVAVAEAEIIIKLPRK